MNQADLNRAMVRATGESTSTIAERGFVPMTRYSAGCNRHELEPERDDSDHEHRVSVITHRQPKRALA